MSPSIPPWSGESEPGASPTPRPHWPMAWFWHVLYIVYCLEVGIFLIFLPWLGIWENNYLIFRYPSIRPIVANSYLKGAVLGLGIVNLLIGIQEIAHFRKGSRDYLSG